MFSCFDTPFQFKYLRSASLSRRLPVLCWRLLGVTFTNRRSTVVLVFVSSVRHRVVTRLGSTFATVAVISAAIAGTVVTETGQTSSCACSTVNLESGNVTLAVLAEGTETGDLSVSQRVTRTNGHAHVRIDAKHDDTAVKIAGETDENGDLVLNVTRNGEVVNDSVVVDASEVETVTFRLEPDGVRITTGEESPSECSCEGLADVVLSGGDSGVSTSLDLSGLCGLASNVAANVTGGDPVVDRNVNAGNVAVNVGDADSGDSAAVASQVIEDVGDQFPSRQNSSRSDGGATGACPNASSADDSSTDISPPPRSSPNTAGVGTNVFRVAIQSSDIVGLGSGDGDRRVSLGGLLSTLGPRPSENEDRN